LTKLSDKCQYKIFIIDIILKYILKILVSYLKLFDENIA
jgi:hypothetical protein